MTRALIGLVALCLAAPAWAQDLPMLKPEALVQGDLVRVGDLIDNAGKIGNTPIFRAPDLGHTGTVQVRRILDAVKPLGLDSLETNGRIEVVVTRDARIIPLAELQEAIAQKAAEKIGVANAAQVQVTLDAGSQPIRLDASRKGELVLASIQFDGQNARFEAVFDVKGGTRPLAHKVYGSAVESVSILTPIRVIQRGEVIKAADLTTETVARSAYGGIARDALVLPTSAIGLAARRPLSPNRPFKNSDLMKPEIVDKNAAVIISYQVPGITLTVRGKALEAGAEGDVVQVQNLQSGKTIQAVITGPNRVTLMATGRPRDSVAQPPATN